MISIAKSEEVNDMCQCCRNRGNVIRIMFECRYGMNAQGVAITLCDKCREELAEKLRLEEETQRDYEQSVEYAQYCERYEPTYNPEDGSM